jgi:hypothetical protein
MKAVFSTAKRLHYYFLTFVLLLNTRFCYFYGVKNSDKINKYDKLDIPVILTPLSGDIDPPKIGLVL